MSISFPIFVSTSGVKDNSVEQAKKLIQNGIRNIELSGGLFIPEIGSQLREMRARGTKLMLHNYFPPPRTPFVFNLASENSEISKKSIELARHAIRLSSENGAKHFAIHAGFLMDPHFSQLGNPITPQKLNSRESALDLFQKRIIDLSLYASNHGVKLLVENNVLSSINLRTFGENPLLLVDPAEIRLFFESNKEYVGLLLDVGHLKVSMESLGMNVELAMEAICEYVVGYHLSENDGLTDQHQELQSNSWFLKKFSKRAEFATLEIHSQALDEIQNSIRIIQNEGDYVVT